MTSAEPERVALSGLFRASPLAGVLSVLGNLAVFYAARVAGVLVNIPEAPGSTTMVPLELPPVVISSLMPAFAAAIVLALLGRLTASPLSIFRGVAVVVLVLSFIPVFLLPAGLGTKVVLSLMHLISGVVITFVLLKFGRGAG
jgi:hypothetical protein